MGGTLWLKWASGYQLELVVKDYTAAIALFKALRDNLHRSTLRPIAYGFTEFGGKTVTIVNEWKEQ